MKALVPVGTPIAVVAPAHTFSEERLEAGLNVAREHGHDLRLLLGPGGRRRAFAGSRQERLDNLIRALTSDEFGAVWMVRGGSGVTDLLSSLPWDRLPKRPVIGFSDITALHVALHQRIGSPCVHGPVLHSLPTTDEPSRESLFALLAGQRPVPLDGEVWVSGRARGPLLGGNLTLLAATCGTPFQLDARGSVLFLEEVGEPPYRIERMLVQLRDAGVLDDLRGVVLGEFSGCDAPKGDDWTLKDALMAHLERLGVPVIAELPIGHGERNHAFLLGAPVLLEGALIFE